MAQKKNKLGFAMLLVLLAVALGVILGVAYISSASIKLASSANLLKASRAKYLAESGLQHALYALWMNPKTFEGTSSANPLGPFYVDDNSDGYVFWAEPDASESGVYTVGARAQLAGVTQSASLTAYRSPGYADLMLQHGPVGYWRLGEIGGTTGEDASGNDYDTAYAGDVALSELGALTGDADTAACLDGVDDYLYREGTEELQISGDMSLSLWVNVAEFPADEMFLATYSQAGDHPLANASYEIALTPDGDIRYLQEYGGGLDQEYIFQDTGLTPGGWHNIVVTRDQDTGTIFLYIDGELLESWVYVPGGPPQPNVGHGGGLYIGSSHGVDRFFHGYMDEPAVLAKTLSAKDIGRLYNASTDGPELKVRRWNY